MAQADGGASQVYRERSQRFAEQRDRFAVRSRRLTHTRLVAFLGAAGALFRLVEPGAGAGALWLAVTAFFTVLFIALIFYHAEIDRRRSWYDALSRLNAEGLARLARDWDALPESNAASDHKHHLADDLDLFGRASLFGLLGTVATPPGRAVLRDWLLEPAEPGTVRDRQAAVAELAPLIDVREEITVRGRMMPQTTPQAAERFLTWAESDPWLVTRRGVIWTARLLPLLTLALVALNAAGFLSYLSWVAALAVNLGFTFTVGKRVHETFDRAFARESALQQYAALFRLVSANRFEAPLLARIQSRLSASGTSAHRQAERLRRLMSLAELRYSMLYLPIQALTLWDFHVLYRLERWQLDAGRRVRDWLAALGAADALAALAALCFENPDWTFPTIVEDEPARLEASGLGHPLIPDGARVVNDVKVGPPGTFLLITGSNMSGKSTLLRAIGTNVVLARAGAPVCAATMRLPPVALETTMRVHDSLQAGLSHFMAQLQRLKGVVDAARRAGKDGTSTLLYLLDDIFQGTNSAERQIAARKVVAHLLAANAIGAVTSHDLQLADTDELSSACDPVHFSEKIEEGPDGPRITFDYKLRPGTATSKNALKLLEMVGLGGGSPDPVPGPDERP
jgi:ABC-type multidrug transport system fused ATPase/permease subunit